MIDLVIVSDAKSGTYKDMTQRCIDSFRTTTSGGIVVVEKQDVDYHGCVVVSQPKRFNYNECLNIGFLLTTADYICFANNDVEFLDGWDCMLDYDYDSMSPINPGWQFHTQFNNCTDPIEGYGIGSTLTGWCILAKRLTIERIGGFDTDVEFWCSDNIYADQLSYHGLSHALIPQSNVRHITSRTLFGSENIGELTRNQAEKYLKAKQKYV